MVSVLLLNYARAILLPAPNDQGRFASCASFNDVNSYRLGLFDVEFSAPKTLADRIVITTKDRITGPQGDEHADVRERRIVDLARAADEQVSSSTDASRVHVGIADLAPVSLGSFFDGSTIRPFQIEGGEGRT
jgi:hypothetical protein